MHGNFSRLFAVTALTLPLALSNLFSPWTNLAHADWQIVPKNSHQLYEAYGLFIDNQSTIVGYGASRAYGGLGGSFAIAGNPDSAAHPQVVVIASVNAAMVFADTGRIYSDAIDVRAGGAYEFALNPMMRLSLGVIHHSGHVADGAIDQDLLDVNANLGDNFLFTRFVYDLGPYARVGATFKPVLHGGPDMNFFGADQFAELHPWGGDDTQKPSPYVAVGIEEGGTAKYGIKTTFHAQIGVYFGNHFSNEFKPTLRPVIGFYTGADPRLKYFQFKNSSATFFYAGLMFDF